MNIQNLGLQENVEVKYRESRCAKFCLKRLKTTGIFVMLLSQGGFKCDPETKLQTMNHFSSEATVQKCSSK